MTRRVALVGNPNVGKSTIFNALTGLHQHTGNWAGVTVSCTFGDFSIDGQKFSAIDLPGIYSFDVRSQEEAVTRDYVRSEDFDTLLLICDATCLERGLHLLAQAAELLRERTETHSLPQTILCVNLCDEAKKKGICIDFSLLQQKLKIPVVACSARTKSGLRNLKQALANDPGPTPVCFACPVFASCSLTEALPIQRLPAPFDPAETAGKVVTYTRSDYRRREEKLDRLLTGPVSGGLIMCLLLVGVFWLTITGANYPSSLLWDFFFGIETFLAESAQTAGLPDWLIGAGIYGGFRVVSWIVSVMLPPMAIFFPLFTLLEDFGYLPRAAFNMDGAFHKCRACGKQCLTMAMGLGCNAAGVVGCRIIDSPRERLIAILTNSLVPCNGRFPLLLTMISLFFMGGTGFWTAGETAALSGPTAVWAGFLPALALTAFILAGIAATLASSWLLSHTLLKGVPSSFTLELPPYRRPQLGKVLVRSLFDRTLFVLGRAVAVAAPAGLMIWLTANITIGNQSLLLWCSGFFEPLGHLMGLDGIILMAFILGFPANEIILPIILMAYLQTGCLVDMNDKSALAALLLSHGWTARTVVCMAIFSLFHWPCSTTCLTVRKETGSLKWTAVAFLLPTCIGVILCILTTALWNILP